MKILIEWLKHLQQLNVWAGILSGGIFGSFFIDGNLTAEKYENMLQDEIVCRQYRLSLNHL